MIRHNSRIIVDHVRGTVKKIGREFRESYHVDNMCNTSVIYHHWWTATAAGAICSGGRKRPDRVVRRSRRQRFPVAAFSGGGVMAKGIPAKRPRPPLGRRPSPQPTDHSPLTTVHCPLTTVHCPLSTVHKPPQGSGCFRGRLHGAGLSGRAYQGGLIRAGLSGRRCLPLRGKVRAAPPGSNGSSLRFSRRRVPSCRKGKKATVPCDAALPCRARGAAGVRVRRCLPCG